MKPTRRTRSAREKATGRRESGAYYGMIPLEVIESEAFRSLPDYATRVLVVLASKYRGGNNGDLSLPAAYAKGCGISGAKLYAALHLLQQVGLIAKTRQGGKKPLGCTLFALEWRKVDASPKYDEGNTGTQTPRHTWARWAKPEDWAWIAQEALSKQRGKPSRARPRLLHGASLTLQSHSPREERIDPTVLGVGRAN